MKFNFIRHWPGQWNLTIFIRVGTAYWTIIMSWNMIGWWYKLSESPIGRWQAFLQYYWRFVLSLDEDLLLIQPSWVVSGQWRIYRGGRWAMAPLPFHWPKKKSTEKSNIFPFYHFYGWINYQQVDIYGGCGQLKCRRDAQDKDSCYKTLARDYKFYLSFENSLCKDYVTEKFFNPLRCESFKFLNFFFFSNL